MTSVEILAVGRLKKSPAFDMFEHYRKQLKWSFKLHEIESKYKDPKTVNDDENIRLMGLIDPRAFVIVLDERGNGLKSIDFAKTVKNLQNSGESYIQFVIGGADGLNDVVRDRANLLLSFGQQTWPHMLVRIMLIEQIYRAQQILAGHPYHRE
jgi:23S rRNA (pseudouridine1915-N3)-methyltransferase